MYRTWQEAGIDPEQFKKDGALAARFWPKVQVEDFERVPGLGPCWVWMGDRFDNGYGSIKIDNRRFGTHQISWALTHDPSADRQFTCHHCDYRPCVRPSHLFEGTPDDNMKDKVAKGRQAKGESLTANRDTARGERCGSAKLTEVQVRAILRKRSSGMIFQAIADEFAVSKTLVRMIVARKSWAHVEV